VPRLSHVLEIRPSNSHFLRFSMVDSDRMLTVHIAVGWLRERAARDCMPTDNPALLFSYYRDEIEAAASVVYDRGYRDGADVVVTGRDFAAAPPLS
jgi:hypothetical protein